MFSTLIHIREAKVHKCKHVVCMCEFREGAQELSLKVGVSHFATESNLQLAGTAFPDRSKTVLTYQSF